ncbi:MAG: DNA repair protein RecO [Planifilum fimeticola]|jgi:DNA repair protein RecO (recombination protein O)
MLIKTEGIVIRTRDYGESHKVVVLFTAERGKLPVMARGAKKPRSRLGAVTQLFTRGQYLCFLGGSGMGTLSQGELLSSHHAIRSDLLLTATAAYLVELLDRLTEEMDPLPALYRLLSSTLDQLEEGTDPDILARIFELRVLEAAGYRPVLDKCTFCGSRDRPVRFSVRQGGFLCSDCLHRDPHTLPLSENAVRILRLLQRMTPERLGEVRVKEETKAQLERVLRAFIDEYTGIAFKSRPFLDQLRKDWSKSPDR